MPFEAPPLVLLARSIFLVLLLERGFVLQFCSGTLVPSNGNPFLRLFEGGYPLSPSGSDTCTLKNLFFLPSIERKPSPS